MSSTPSLLVAPKDVETSIASQYEAENVRAIISRATATNQSSAELTLDVYLLGPGVSSSDSSRIINARRIAPGQCMVLSELAGHVVPIGGSLAAKSSGSGITLAVSGDEVI